MTPANIAGLAKLAGAELIAVTDHNAADNLPAVQCCCNAYGLRLLPGVEVNTAEEIHVLCYFKTVDTALEFGRLLYAALPEFPYDPAVWGRQLVMDENDEVLRTVDKLLTGAVSMDIYEVKAACEALGGVAVPAHVEKDSYALLSVLGFLPEDLPFAAVELHDASRLGGLVEKVIPRNTTIPVARAQDFTSFKDGLTAMSIHVMQGERELVQDCRSLARFALRGIPALPAGGAHIRVTFQVDADGLLSVTAMEKSTGVEASIQVKPSYGLTDSEIASMIKDSMSYAEQDVKARMLAEQKVEAARVLESLHGALAADAALLSAAERQVIDDAAAHLSEVAQGDDVDAIEQAIKNVDKQTQDFAARRMDQSVRRALKGHSVDEV